MNTLGTIRSALERALPHMELPGVIDYVTNFLVTGDNQGEWTFYGAESLLDMTAVSLVFWFCRLRRQSYGSEEFDAALENVRGALSRLERNLLKTP